MADASSLSNYDAALHKEKCCTKCGGFVPKRRPSGGEHRQVSHCYDCVKKVEAERRAAKRAEAMEAAARAAAPAAPVHRCTCVCPEAAARH